MAETRITPPKVDQVKAFMLFAFFGGDVIRTANAAGCDPRIIEALAHDFTWRDKIRGQQALSTKEGLATEREANRAANYVVAKRFGALLEQIAIEATANPDEWARMHLVDVDPETGDKTFNPKPLVELAKAAEIIQNMTYRALGDKVAGEAGTVEKPEGSATNLAINIYHGLSKLQQAAKKVDAVVDITPAVNSTVGDVAKE